MERKTPSRTAGAAARAAPRRSVMLLLVLLPCQALMVGLMMQPSRAAGDVGCGMGPPCHFMCKGGCSHKVLTPHKEPMSSVISRITEVAEAQAAATVKALPHDQYPHSYIPGNSGWNTTKANAWTSGFFPGVLWQLHRLTGKPEWREHGHLWTAGLANLQRDWALQHDYGFVYLPSFGEEFDITKSGKAKRQLLAAAEATSWAFNPAVNATRTFEGWDPPHSSRGFRQLVIIDHIMNIEVLVAAAKAGTPRTWMDTTAQDWVDMALAHARTVAKNHVRPDGSVYHIVEYHPIEGTINKKYNYQGYADDSTWARGQAWAMAGFAQLYLDTKAPDMLEAAETVADRWLALLGQQDGPEAGGWVPKWDFDAPIEAQFHGPLDTSAAAVAALAFLRLAEAHPPDSPCGRRYLCAGANTLRALAGSKYLAAPAAGAAGPVLWHATGNRPEKSAVDVGIIWGDYYLLKAVELCKRLPGCADSAKTNPA